MKEILRALEIQRWDDHRYYHHSRVNQSLHFLSATSFLASYALLFVYPVAAALLGWIVAMWSRQIGHFFFEPKGYDHINQATHEYKEEIKVGYNLRRKVVLLAIWGATFLLLLADWTISELGLLWLALGAGGLLFRTVHLFFIRDIETGLVWMLKILTDPFHDLKLYCKAPLALMRGELIDPNLEDEVAERAARA
jgi:Protein of unknown function (DUF962)